MSKKPTATEIKVASVSSEPEQTSRHYYRGNIYEVFYVRSRITHSQIHFPSPSSFPSASSFTDFPYDVQQHFLRLGLYA
jgi:hypothetical protein